MKTKSMRIIIPAVVLIIAIAAALFYFLSSPYSGYSGAFDKTMKAGSMEYELSVSITMDGKQATSAGNMKIRGIGSKVNFINIMNIDGKTITQFTDGDFIYMDDGVVKSKIKIGEKPQQQERGEFSAESYIQQFSSLLDAGKIKDLKIAEKIDQKIIQNIEKKSVGGKTEYKVTVAPALVSDILNVIVNSEASGQANPECNMKSFTYGATVNSAGFVDSITYNADMDVKFPAALTGGSDEAKNVQLTFSLVIVNPGTEVSFTLPDTNRF